MRLVEIIEGPYQSSGFVVCIGFVMDKEGRLYEEELLYESFREAYEDMADLAEGIAVELEDDDERDEDYEWEDGQSSY